MKLYFRTHAYKYYIFTLCSGLRLTVEGVAKCKWTEKRGTNEFCYEMQVDELSLQALEKMKQQ